MVSISCPWSPVFSVYFLEAKNHEIALTLTVVMYDCHRLSARTRFFQTGESFRIPVDNFGTVVGENPTPILSLWAVNSLSIVYWDLKTCQIFGHMSIV